MTPSRLEISTAGRVSRIHISRPARDPVSAERLADEFMDALAALQEGAHERDVSTAVVISCAAGFGVDGLEVSADLGAAGTAWARLTVAVAAVPYPVIAVLSDRTVGPALGLALAADLRVAADDITLAVPDLTRDGLPGGGVTQRLPRLVGAARALQLILLGDSLTAAQAADWGLVQSVCDRADLESSVDRMVDGLDRAAPTALRFAKECVRLASELPLRDGLTVEADLSALLQTTMDQAEGLRAFRERRDPTYEGS